MSPEGTPPPLLQAISRNTHLRLVGRRIFRAGSKQGSSQQGDGSEIVFHISPLSYVKPVSADGDVVEDARNAGVLVGKLWTSYPPDGGGAEDDKRSRVDVGSFEVLDLYVPFCTPLGCRALTLIRPSLTASPTYQQSKISIPRKWYERGIGASRVSNMSLLVLTQVSQFHSLEHLRLTVP
jgi:hypothetical protein